MVKVSVIIPTYNEEKDIFNCLKSLESQTLKNFEIIVVDDGSKDKTREVVKKFKKVKLIEGEHKGPGFSRNLGAKQARGEILILIDADMTFDKDYIKNLTTPLFKDKKLIGTTHDYEIVPDLKNIWSRCWGKIRVSKEESKKVTIFRAIRKSKFLELGGFDSKYGYADDQTFWYKYKIKPEPAKNTTCYHTNPTKLKNVFKQSRWIGASLENKLISIYPINYFIPSIMLIISPIAIPILSLKKVIKNNDLKIFFPWMLIFMTFRYFGTISGLSRKIYLNINVR